MASSPILTVYRTGSPHELHTTNGVGIVIASEHRTLINGTPQRSRCTKIRVTGKWRNDEKIVEGERELVWHEKDLEPVDDAITRLGQFILSRDWQNMSGDRRVCTDLLPGIVATIGIRGQQEYASLTFKQGTFAVEAEVDRKEGLLGFYRCLQSALH